MNDGKNKVEKFFNLKQLKLLGQKKLKNDLDKH